MIFGGARNVLSPAGRCSQNHLSELGVGSDVVCFGKFFPLPVAAQLFCGVVKVHCELDIFCRRDARKLFYDLAVALKDRSLHAGHATWPVERF